MQEFPEFAEELLSRFLKYVKVWTTSDTELADKGIMPSTKCQLDLANLLCDELNSILGINSSFVTKNGYVCLRIPATLGFENAKGICFLSHLDTSSDAPGENVKPIVYRNYDGSIDYIGKETQNGKENLLGDTIITSDGTTLLGSDDKAGIAELITAIDIILKEKISHGQIEVVFTPDEETGHGMDNFPLDWIQSKVAYTVDGGECGEIECECFNAYKTEVFFTGKALHTGNGKAGLINAINLANLFYQNIPQDELPENTEGYEGFYAPISIEGEIEKAKMTFLVRDFTNDGIKKRLKTLEDIALKIEKDFPKSKIEVKHTEQYKNMKEKIDEFPFVMENLYKASLKAGVEPFEKAIRGGTDGSRLTELGIPTPNIFTGGHNFHSKMEWSSLNQMCYTVKTLIELVKIFAEK